MKNLLLLISILSFSFLSLSGSRNYKTYYLSKVEKNSVSTFIARYASNDAHYVITSKKIPHALEEVSFEDPTGGSFYVQEHHQELPNGNSLELARLDHFVVIDGSSTHNHNHTPTVYEEFKTENLEITSTSTTPKFELTVKNNLTDFAPFDVTYFKQKHYELTGKTEVTVEGKKVKLGERRTDAGRKLARNYLKQEYEKLGLKFEEVPYQNSYSGINYRVVIPTNEAQDGRYIIISAHYDTVGRTAGADDNGAGTIALLSLAKELKDKKLPFDIHMVGFDQEELGLWGATGYVGQIAKSPNGFKGFLFNINMDTIGYDSDNDGGIHVIDCDENKSADVTKILMNVVSTNRLNLKKEDACTNRSDHAVFWKYNQPAVVVSENFFAGDSNPCYHQSCDDVSKINYTLVQNILEMIYKSLSGARLR